MRNGRRTVATRRTRRSATWLAVAAFVAGVAAGARADDVQVNTRPETAQLPQDEPSVVSDPRDDRRLVAAFADVQNPVEEAEEEEAGGPDVAPGVSLSRDGGRSWRAPAGGPVLPDPPGFTWGDRREASHLAGSDSAVAWSIGDRLFSSTLGFQDPQAPPTGDCAAGGLYVYRSDDAGETWTLPAGGPAFANTTTLFRDKEYIAADAGADSPHAGNVYMVWDDDRYAACPQQFPGNFVVRHIEFAHSADGATWSTPIQLAAGCIAGPIPAVAANGDVYVAWYDCQALPNVRYMVAKSVDGGGSFETPRIAVDHLEPPPNPLPGSRFRVPPFPALATDPTDTKRVFLSWSANAGASQADVFVARSLDGGGTWSPPARLNDDPPDNPRDQFFPWIAVSAAGVVRVMWGDDRLDVVNAGGRTYDVFAAESGDHGASFGANRRVSTASSDPDHTGYEGPAGDRPPFVGDYFGLSASGVAIWTDTRNGDDDIFAAPLAPPSTVCGDADGNGSVTVTDGVQVLRAAAELSSSCTLAACDVDGDGGIGVTDGVNVLRKAAGLAAADACPAG
jgi:hypothetical protein